MYKIDEVTGDIGEEVKLTKEEAIDLHRQMWRDMAEEEKKLGSPIDRCVFKSKWCKEHGYGEVWANCFLCEYDNQKEGGCISCPIDWGNEDNYCGRGTDPGLDYLQSPIEAIAEAPLRKEKKNVKRRKRSGVNKRGSH